MTKYKFQLFPVSAALYLMGTLFLFPVLRYYIDFADTFSYITIAEKYHAGIFSDAINGFWSPMISWLLSFLIFTNADVFLLFKILEVALGLSGLYFTAQLIGKLRIRKSFGYLLQLSFVPCFWSFSLLWCTADLLFLNILLLLHVIFIDFDGLNQRRVYAIGITGALLYFAKAYGFFYFIIFCSFGYALISYRDKFQQRKILINAIKSFAVFVFLSAFWITAISIKYEHITLSTGASYNESLSPSINKIIVHPVISNGLSDPRINHSMFAWENPVLYNSDFGIPKASFDIQKKIKTLERNISSFYYYQYRAQIGWLFLAALFIALVFLRKNKERNAIAILIFTILAFPSAYFFVILHDRFIWIVTILMGISIFYICHLLAENKKQWLAWLLAIPCCLLLIKRPMKEILWRTDTSKSISELAYGFTHFKSTLVDTYHQDAVVFSMADSLRNRSDLKGTATSFNNSIEHPRESYPLSLIICHYLHNPYFGQLNRSIIEQNKLEPLFEKKVDFYYVWMHDSLNDELVKPLPLVYENEEAGLRIYKVDSSRFTETAGSSLVQ